MKRIHVLPVVALCSMLAACAGTTDSHYYSLMPLADTAAPQPSAAMGGQAARPGYAISVDAVHVPQQVDKPQIVLNDPDSAQVTPLNGYLWASTLSEELRAALADDLSRKLNVIEIPAKAAPEHLGLWKIDLRVQRFESLYGQRVLLDATWRLRPVNLPGRRAMFCRAEITVPVQGSMSALVSGHKQALGSMSGLIAAAIQGNAPRAEQAGPGADGEQVRVLGCTQG